MIIINQDKDMVYLSTKEIKVKKHFATINNKRIFCGYNLYAGQDLLGTFDSKPFAEKILADIRKSEQSGKAVYTVPEEPDADDLAESEVIANV